MICEILDIYWESRCQAETAEFHYQPKNAPFIAKMAKFSTEKPSYEAENSLRRGLSMVGQLLNGVVEARKGPSSPSTKKCLENGKFRGVSVPTRL
jgi:hypothetical protein